MANWWDEAQQQRQQPQPSSSLPMPPTYRQPAGMQAGMPSLPMPDFSQNPFDHPAAFSQPQQAQTPEQVPTPQEPGLLSDIGNLLKAGYAQTGQGLNWLASQIPGAKSIPSHILDLEGNADYWKRTSDAATQALSKQQQEAGQQKFINDDYSLGPAWSNPRAYLGGVVESIPGTLMGMAIGGPITKGLASVTGAVLPRVGIGAATAEATGAAIPKLTQAATNRVAMASGAVGYGTGEGLVAAATDGVQARDLVLNMDRGELKKSSPLFQDLIKKGYSDEQAHQEIANTIGRQVATRSGVTVAALGAPMGAVFGKWFHSTGGDRLTKSLLGEIGVGMAGEGGQEFLQSGAEQFFQNQAIRQHANPEQTLWQDVFNQAVSGALSGALMGAPFGAAGHVSVQSQQRQQAGSQANAQADRIEALRDQLNLASEQDITKVLQGFDELEKAGNVPKPAAARLIAARQQLQNELALRSTPDALSDPLETARGQAGYLGLSERADELNDGQLHEVASRALPDDAPESFKTAQQRYQSALKARTELNDAVQHFEQNPDAIKGVSKILSEISTGKPLDQGGYEGSADYTISKLSDDALIRYLRAGQALLQNHDEALGKSRTGVEKSVELLGQEAQRRAKGERRDPDTIRLTDIAGKLMALPDKQLEKRVNGLPAEALERLASGLDARSQLEPQAAERAAWLRERATQLRQQASRAWDESASDTPISPKTVTDDQGVLWERGQQNQLRRTALAEEVAKLNGTEQRTNTDFTEERNRLKELALRADTANRQKEIQARESEFRARQQQDNARNVQEFEQRQALPKPDYAGYEQAVRDQRRAETSARVGLSQDEIIQLSEINSLRARAGLPSLSANDFKAARADQPGILSGNAAAARDLTLADISRPLGQLGSMRLGFAGALPSPGSRQPSLPAPPTASAPSDTIQLQRGQEIILNPNAPQQQRATATPEQQQRLQNLMGERPQRREKQQAAPSLPIQRDTSRDTLQDFWPPIVAIPRLAEPELRALSDRFNAWLERNGDRTTQVRMPDGSVQNTIITNRNNGEIQKYGGAIEQALAALPPPRHKSTPSPTLADLRRKGRDYQIAKARKDREQRINGLKAKLSEKGKQLASEEQARLKAGQSRDQIAAAMGEDARKIRQYRDWLNDRAFDTIDSSGKGVNPRAVGARYTEIPADLIDYIEEGQKPSTPNASPSPVANARQEEIQAPKKPPVELPARPATESGARTEGAGEKQQAQKRRIASLNDRPLQDATPQEKAPVEQPQAGEHYPMPTNESEDHESFSRWSDVEKGRRGPNIHERRLMNSVGRALDADRSSTREIDEFVEKDLGNYLPPNRKNGVEGGANGMEIYRALHAVEAERERYAQVEAGKSFHVGDKLKNLPFIHQGKKYKILSAVITAVDAKTGAVTFKGTTAGRGGHIEVMMSALDLQQILENSPQSTHESSRLTPPVSGNQSGESKTAAPTQPETPNEKGQAEAETETVLNDQPPATGAESKQQDTKTETILSADELKWFQSSAGWTKKGGQLLRDESGKVTGRTKWVARSDWWEAYKGSGKGTLAEGEAKAQLQNAIEGKPVSAAGRRLLDFIENYRNEQNQQLSDNGWLLDDVDLQEAGFDDLSAQERATAQLQAEANRDLGEDVADSIFERVSAQHESSTPEQFNAALEAAFNDARQRKSAEGGQSSSQSEPSAPAETGGILKDYSIEEIRAEERRIKQEQDRQAAKDRERDNKAQADKAAKDFTLTGSDRPADVAMAQGQRDLLTEDKEPPRNSIQSGPRRALSIPQARAALIEGLGVGGAETVRNLEASGKLVFEPSDPTGLGAQGYVDRQGVLHLIPANLTSAALSVGLHEGFHIAKDTLFIEGDRALIKLVHAALSVTGLKNFIGNPGYNDLVQQARRMVANGQKDAIRALDKAKRSAPHNVDEEHLAYLVEYAPHLPLVRRILSAIRAALYRMGVKINLTPADIRALAVSALKNYARQSAATPTPAAPRNSAVLAEDDDAEQARLWEEFQRIKAEFQTRQASETAFQRWFGKGVEGVNVRDGKPLKLYHGTNSAPFYHLETAKQGAATAHPTSGLGFFLTANIRAAKRYGDTALEFYAKISNPYYLTHEDLMGVNEMADARRLQTKMRNKGYDAAIVTAPGSAPYVIVFDSKQIKFTSNENPTDSPDFRYSFSDAAKIDKEYMDAVINGDIETAQKMVVEAAKQKGYVVNNEYRIQHAAPNREDQSLATVLDSKLVPKDYWMHPEWYQTTPEEFDSFRKVMSALRGLESSKKSGNNDNDFYITVYRSVPKSLKEKRLRNGDWVTPSSAYARVEGGRIEGGYRLISQKTSLRNLWWDGNSIAEFGYDDGNSYAYSNTKNNVKRIDPIVYDDNGDIVPLSKRFNPKKDDIRYSIPNRQDNEQKPIPPAETPAQAVQRRIQDKFVRFQIVQDWIKKAGINLTPAADVYGAEELLPKKTAAAVLKARTETLKPLVEEAAKNKWAIKGNDLIDAIAENQPLPTKFNPSIDEFLRAQHAPEANAEIAKKNPAFPDGGSGLTNQQAAAILAKYKALPDFAAFAALANQFQAITKQTRALLVASGRITQQTATTWERMYKHYIPLKGGPEDKAQKTGTGPGISMKETLKQRLGHSLREENVVENIWRDHERALYLNEKKAVTSALKALLQQTNNEAVGTVGKPEKHAVLHQGWYHQVWIEGSPFGAYPSYSDAKAAIAADSQVTGRPVSKYAVRHQLADPSVIYTSRPLLADNEVAHYENGQLIRLQLNDELMARAAKNLGVDAASGLLRAGMQFNRMLSHAYTGYNPEFILSNVARDFTAGFINLTGNFGTGFAVKALKNYPMAVRALWQDLRGNKNALIEQYRAAGGSTGAAYMSDLERIGTDIKQVFQDYQGAAETWKSGDKAGAVRVALYDKLYQWGGRWIEALNSVGENALRVATFKAALDANMTEQKAARAAANVTVNFNRKGEMASTLGGLYLFFNPSVQGTKAMFDALAKGEHRGQAQALAGSLALLALTLAELARGWDDDSERKWRQIPGYVKDRNMLLSVGGDKQLAIPVPYGYGLFWSFGNLLSDMIHGENKDKLGIRLASSLFEQFSPVGNPFAGDEMDIKNIVSMLPTMLKPPVALALNRNEIGRPLMPEAQSWNTAQPDSALKWKSTQGTIYDRIATGINSLTGGNAYQSGAIDVSPESLRYIVRTLTGGVGQFVGDTASLFTVIGSGAIGETEPHEYPILRRFFRESSIQNARSLFNEQAGQVRKAVDAFNAARRAKDAQGIREVVANSRELLMLNYVLESTQKQIKARRQLESAIDISGLSVAEKRRQKDAIEKQEEAIYSRFFDIFEGTTKRKAG